MVTYKYSFLFCWCFCSLFLFSFLTSFVGLSHSELFETQKKTVFSRVLHLRYVQESSTLLLALAFIRLELRKKKTQLVLKQFLLRYQKRLKIMPKVLIKPKHVNFCQKSQTISIFDEFCLNCFRILNIYNCHLHFQPDGKSVLLGTQMGEIKEYNMLTGQVT